MEEQKKVTTIKITINGVPEDFFAEWDEVCKKSFGDCRWMKLYNDHNIAKQFEDFVSMYGNLASQIEDLKGDVAKIDAALNKKTDVKETNKVTLLGGEGE